VDGAGFGIGKVTGGGVHETATGSIVAGTNLLSVWNLGL
jgi:hypothetical protein